MSNPIPPGFPLALAVPGQPLGLSAADWNALAGGANRGAPAPPLPTMPGQHGPETYVMIRNDHATKTVYYGASVALGDCLTPHYRYAGEMPGGSGLAAQDAQNHDALAAFSVTFALPRWPGHFCVALEPIPPGEMGRAIVTGLTWAFWFQHQRDDNYNDTGYADALALDLCENTIGTEGYLSRGFPGRARIVWAPDILTVPELLDARGAYVWGLIYLTGQPPSAYELATKGTATTTLTTDGNVQGYFQTFLPAFADLTADLGHPFERIDDRTLQALRSGAYHLDFAAQIGPGTLTNPWPDNNPARTLKHTYRLRPQLSSNSAGTAGIVAGNAAERDAVYPAATISAEAWDVMTITRGQYVKLSLDGYGPGASAYGSVAKPRFSARLITSAPSDDQQTVWDEAHSPI